MDANPTRNTPDALKKHPRCGAHCRTTGKPCRGPAMANGRCRMHGGNSPGAPAGKAHWNYRHGQRSKKAQESRREYRELMKLLEKLMGVAEGSL